MIKGEAERQAGFEHQGVLFDDRLLHDAAHAQNGAFRRPDDGREEIDVRKSKVGDGEGAVEEIIRGKPVLPEFFDQFCDFEVDVSNRLRDRAFSPQAR